MAEFIRIEGLSEVKDAILDLPKSTGKNIIRRILRKRAQILAEAAKTFAPVYDGPPRRYTKKNGNVVLLHGGMLKRSIKVASKLTKSQRRLARETASYVEVYVGPGSLPQAMFAEFGSSHAKPHPYLRPAWDANKLLVIEGIKADLWVEIQKAIERAARKTARLKAKAAAG